MTRTTRLLPGLLGLLLAVTLVGCVLPPQQTGDDDDDDDDTSADDDTGDDDTGDDDTGDDDTGDDDTGDDDTGDDDTGDDDTGDDDTGDDDTGDDDTGDDDTGDDDTGAPDDTIWDIQGGNIAEDAVVDLGDVVLTTPVSVAPNGFWIQEPDSIYDPMFSGIYVYVPDDLEAAAVAAAVGVGNRVDLIGRYQEYYDLSEVVVDFATDVVVIGTSSLPPTNVQPCDVGTGGSHQEPYESVLVRVTNVTVTDDNPDDPNDYGEFVVNGCLRVDDFFFGYEPSVGQNISAIVGVMNYAYGQAKLEPRGPADVIP